MKKRQLKKNVTKSILAFGHYDKFTIRKKSLLERGTISFLSPALSESPLTKLSVGETFSLPSYTFPDMPYMYEESEQE